MPVIRVPQSEPGGGPAPATTRPTNEGQAEQIAAKAISGLSGAGDALLRVQLDRIQRKRAEEERLARKKEAEQERLARKKESEQERLARKREAEQEQEARKLQSERAAADNARLGVILQGLDAQIGAILQDATDPEIATAPPSEQGIPEKVQEALQQARQEVLDSIQTRGTLTKADAILEATAALQRKRVDRFLIAAERDFLARERQQATEQIIQAPPAQGPGLPDITGRSPRIDTGQLDSDVAAIFSINAENPDPTSGKGGSEVARWAQNQLLQVADDEATTLQVAAYIMENSPSWVQQSTSDAADEAIAKVRQQAERAYRNAFEDLVQAASSLAPKFKVNIPGGGAAPEIEGIDIPRLLTDPQGEIDRLFRRKDEVLSYLKQGARLGVVSEPELAQAMSALELEKGKVAQVFAQAQGVLQAIDNPGVSLDLTPEVSAQADLVWPFLRAQLQSLDKEGRIERISQILDTFKGNAPPGLAQYLKDLNIGNTEDLEVLTRVMLPYVVQPRLDPMAFEPGQRGWIEPGPVLDDGQLAAVAFMADLLLAGRPPAEAAGLVISQREEAAGRVSDPAFQEQLDKLLKEEKGPLSFDSVSKVLGDDLDPKDVSHLRFYSAVRRFAEAQLKGGQTTSTAAAVRAGIEHARRLYSFENGKYEYLSPLISNPPDMVRQDIESILTKKKDQFSGQVPSFDDVDFIPLVGTDHDPSKIQYLISVTRGDQPPVLLEESPGQFLKYDPDPGTSVASDLLRIRDIVDGAIQDPDSAAIQQAVASQGQAQDMALGSLMLDVVGGRTATSRSLFSRRVPVPPERLEPLVPESMIDEFIEQQGVGSVARIVRERGRNPLFTPESVKRDFIRGFLARSQPDRIVDASRFGSEVPLMNFDPRLREVYRRAIDANSDVGPNFARSAARGEVLAELTGSRTWWKPDTWTKDVLAEMRRLRAIRAYDKLDTLLNLQDGLFPGLDGGPSGQDPLIDEVLRLFQGKKTDEEKARAVFRAADLLRGGE